MCDWYMTNDQKYFHLAIYSDLCIHMDAIITHQDVLERKLFSLVSVYSWKKISVVCSFFSAVFCFFLFCSLFCFVLLCIVLWGCVSWDELYQATEMRITSFPLLIDYENSMLYPTSCDTLCHLSVGTFKPEYLIRCITLIQKRQTLTIYFFLSIGRLCVLFVVRTCNRIYIEFWKKDSVVELGDRYDMIWFKWWK